MAETAQRDAVDVAADWAREIAEGICLTYDIDMRHEKADEIRDAIAEAIHFASNSSAAATLEEVKRIIREQIGDNVDICGIPCPDHLVDDVIAEIDALPLPAPGAPASPWRPIEEAPEGVWLPTWREGESRTSVAMKVTGDEWCSPDGRTTITHSTYLPPTHFMLPTPPASKDT